MDSPSQQQKLNRARKVSEALSVLHLMLCGFSGSAQTTNINCRPANMMGEIKMSPGDKLIIDRAPDGTAQLRHIAYQYEYDGSTASAHVNANAITQHRGCSEPPSKLMKLEDGQGISTLPRGVDVDNSSKDGPGTSEAGGGNKLTIIASKDLEDIRAGIVESSNENAQLRHQLAMLEKRLADAEYHARLYWQCGMDWARQEMQWIEERERLLGRVRMLQQRMLAEKSVHEGGGTAGKSEAATCGVVAGKSVHEGGGTAGERVHERGGTAGERVHECGGTAGGRVHECGGTTGKSEAATCGVVAGKSESAGGGGGGGGGDGKPRFLQPSARYEGVMVENGQGIPGLGDGPASSNKGDMMSCKAAQSDAGKE
ncbi:hypothetical protein PV05_03344 [Exophiala xenobiotica]|uniref:Uncharacterized protein n=1 Tax=Exophiala xenobiotica TaxID=348802 RepID=A0A0D2C229_9EURO|nr:uncharacterized protein PV05_03344 [Exophiala xenobiotica]KIW58851.1 hypothetical protein PV05_03344 [Exophiala xenobiotica]